MNGASQRKFYSSSERWVHKKISLQIQASVSLPLQAFKRQQNKSPHKTVRAALKKKVQPFFFFIWKDLEMLKPKKISPLPQLYSEPVKIALSFIPFELVKCN